MVRLRTAVALAAAALGGCGGEDGETTSTDVLLGVYETTDHRAAADCEPSHAERIEGPAYFRIARGTDGWILTPCSDIVDGACMATRGERLIVAQGDGTDGSFDFDVVIAEGGTASCFVGRYTGTTTLEGDALELQTNRFEGRLGPEDPCDAETALEQPDAFTCVRYERYAGDRLDTP